MGMGDVTDLVVTTGAMRMPSQRPPMGGSHEGRLSGSALGMPATARG